MIVKDEKTLDLFRGPGKCELCGKVCKVREPHHIFCRGLGGGNRLDIACNLLALGSTKRFECECHSRVDTKAGRERCLQIVAKRERCEPSDVEAAVKFLQRFPKGMPTSEIRQDAFMDADLSSNAYAIVYSTSYAMPDQSPAPSPVRKRKKKPKTGWAAKAGELRRAACKASYQRVKAGRKASKQP